MEPAEHSGSAGSGKAESFFQQAALHTGARAYVQQNGEQYDYAVPKTGLDLCPMCHTGTLHPVGQTHDEIHLTCRNGDCNQRVFRPKKNRLSHFLDGG